MSSRRLRSQGEIAARRTDEVLTNPPSSHQIVMSWGRRKHKHQRLRLYPCSNKIRKVLGNVDCLHKFYRFHHNFKFNFCRVIMRFALRVFSPVTWRAEGGFAWSWGRLQTQRFRWSPRAPLSPTFWPFCKKALLGPSVSRLRRHFELFHRSAIVLFRILIWLIFLNFEVWSLCF